MILCGQLGLNVRDHQALLYVVDAEHHITLFSYERGELLGSFAGHQHSPIIPMARIDRTHFISADSSGIIQYWDTHTKFPIRTWETEDNVRALCYCNAQSVLYMTYHFTEQGFKHEFNVWRFDGTHKNLYYTHEYINAVQVESLPRMLCYLTLGIGLFTDPSVAKTLIYHVMQTNEQNDTKKVKSEQSG